MGRECRLIGRTVALSASVVAMSAAAAHGAAAYTGLVVFGDSLSDVGNYSVSSGGAVPGPAYYQGGFSNGPNYVDDLAGKLGLPDPTPSLLGGTDYAFGGAQSYMAPQQPTAVPQPTNQQVASYLASNTPSPTTLYDVFSGANDVVDALYNGEPLSQTPEVEAGAASVAADVNAIYQAGGRQFLVFNLPLLGQAPEYTEGGNSSQTPFADQLSLAFNTTLAAGLAQVEVEDPGIVIHTVDSQSLFAAIEADPAAYGLTNATDPAAPGLTTGDDNYNTANEVSDPQDYLFWDDLHPTEAGNALLADAAYTAAVPEPTSVAVAAAALLLCLGRRRAATV